MKIDIDTLSKEINRYILEEKVVKHQGNDAIQVIEFVDPKLNEQCITISIILLTDFYKETNLRNKTYYSWGKVMLDLGTNDYPIFKYLTIDEVNVIKKLLE